MDIFDQIAVPSSPPPQGDIFDAIAPQSVGLKQNSTMPMYNGSGPGNHDMLRAPGFWERLEMAVPKLFGQGGTVLQPEQPVGALPALHQFLTTAPPQFSQPQAPEQQSFMGNLGNALGRQATPLNIGMMGVGVPGLAAAESLPVGTSARALADIVKVIFAAQGAKGTYDVAKETAQGLAQGQPVGPTLGTATGELPMNLLMAIAPFLAHPTQPTSGIKASDVTPEGITHQDVQDSGGAVRATRPSGTPDLPIVGQPTAPSQQPLTLDQNVAQALMDSFQRNMIAPAVQATRPPVEGSGGEVSFRGQGVPNARQQGFEQPLVQEPVMEQPQGVTGPTAPFQRTSPLTQEQQLARQRKANVVRGLYDQSGQYIGSEEQPMAHEGQFPQEGGPQGTFSRLQRQRIQAGQGMYLPRFETSCQ